MKIHSNPTLEKTIKLVLVAIVILFCINVAMYLAYGLY